jgi:demethylmenaquinone methyltransferase/2-methoxy-6-polyprenyl-1,4-benzoquinol methylase
MSKFYPDSKVEIDGFAAKYYDSLMNFISLGFYNSFINKAISDMNIKTDDKILDLGAGTGRNALLMNKYLGENGQIVGLDINEIMINHFKKNTENFPKLVIKNQRIDQPFDLDLKFDKVFISFVIHGFPNEIRMKIIENAKNSLKPDGRFYILDFNEFYLERMPFYLRIPFTKIECKYAFDFIKRDWKGILLKNGFKNPKEFFYFGNYVRLLSMGKS